VPDRDLLRIAGGQGFWGDSLEAPVRQVEDGPIDYLVMDYLAEVTMSIMRKLKDRDPDAGYARDFVTLMHRIFPACIERGIRVVANAGGVNPTGCAEAICEAGREAGVGGRARVGLVTGDDLMDRLDDLIAQGHELAHMETGEPLSAIRDRVRSANAYFGASTVVEALAQGADVVVTGRCADPVLTAAPLIHEFGWSMDDHDLMAAGVLAGHVNECGAQATGGNAMPEWWTTPGYDRIGFPVLEVEPSGAFTVTKHPGSGGRVNRATVTEQVVYEIGDPESFLTPDVTADFTTIELSEVGQDRVRLQGIRGRAPTDFLKVSVAYTDGWKSEGTLLYTWPDAVAKARTADRMLRDRFRRLGFKLDDVHTEFVGWNAAHAHLAGAPPADAPEVQLRVAVRSKDRASVERFTREMAPLVLTGPPSVTGYAGGRGRVQEIVAYWPALIRRDAVEPHLAVRVLDV